MNHVTLLCHSHELSGTHKYFSCHQSWLRQCLPLKLKKTFLDEIIAQFEAEEQAS